MKKTKGIRALRVDVQQRPGRTLEKIEAAKEAQHVAATCPECGDGCGAPFDLSGHGKKNDAREMLCGACGKEWRTDDPEEIAAAWYGIASYEKTHNAWPSGAEMAEEARINRQQELYEQNMAAKKA